MARPLRIQFPGAFYHITCRGIERRKIFMDDKDRYKFLALLTGSLETYQVVLHAYIMMTNHFHLLIQTKKANCSEFMRHFNICYTGWFNYRHDRSGGLYQGRYKSFLIDADNYLLELSRYLHLNGVRVRGMKSMAYQEKWRYARDYPWSSLRGYVSERHAVSIIAYDLILSMVGSRRGYRNFVIDGLKRGIGSPFKSVKSRIILGDEEFILKAKRFLKRGSVREQPSYRDLVMRTMAPEEVIRILTKEFGISKKALQRRGVNGEIRGIGAELLYKYSDITQAQIGRLLGDIDYVSVHHLRRRLREKMSKSMDMRKRYQKVEAKLKAQCKM
jgi:putative transposase